MRKALSYRAVADALWPRWLRPSHPPAEGTDAHLLERFARQRDEAAFAALMERHGPMVLGVCRRVVRNAQDADDAFQATFLVLVRKAASLRRPERLGNWLYGVAYRIALQARAGAARRRTVEGQVEHMVAAEPVNEIVWDELRPVLDEEINRLAEKYRAPVVLCHLEGKTYAEAARLLGWAEGTVSGRLARAREKLRKRLTHRGVTLSAAVVTATLCQQGSAAVPAALAQATLQGAVLTAAGQAAAGLVSANALALAQSALRVTLAVKLKVLAALLVVVGLVGAGVWVATYGSAAAAAHLSHFLQPGRKTADDTAKVQGTWHCVAAQTGGSSSVPADLTWTFQGNTLVIRENGRERRGTFKLDRYLVIHPTIEYAVPETPGGPPIALTGAYAFTKDRLIVCFNKDPSLQPKTVRPNPANGDVRYDFKRED